MGQKRVKYISLVLEVRRVGSVVSCDLENGDLWYRGLTWMDD